MLYCVTWPLLEQICQGCNILAGFLKEFFQGGESIVMQISFVMLLFSDQISGGGKSLQGANCLRG